MRLKCNLFLQLWEKCKEKILFFNLNLEHESSNDEKQNNSKKHATNGLAVSTSLPASVLLFFIQEAKRRDVGGYSRVY